VRFAIGWEDPNSPENEEKRVQEFLGKHEGKPVIPLPEGENYF